MPQAQAIDHNYQVLDGKVNIPRLELRAAEHCNIRCSSCSQNSPNVADSFPNLAALRHSLEILSKSLSSDKIIILGGEPTLNSDLDELISIAKLSNISGTVSMLTNGLRLERLSDFAWAELNQVEISIYPSTKENIRKQLPKLFEKSTSNNTNIRLIPMNSFRTIVLPFAHTSSPMASAVFESCYYRRFCRTVYAGKFYCCAPCINIDPITYPSSPYDGDGVSIEANKNLFDDIREYLDRKTPLKACYKCAGTNGMSFPHQLARGNREQEPNTEVDLRDLFELEFQSILRSMDG